MGSPGEIRSEEIRTYLAPAILATCLCCPPLGLIAILFATRVGSRIRAGDYVGARRASRTARGWCIATVVGGIFLCIPGMLLLLLALFLDCIGSWH